MALGNSPSTLDLAIMTGRPIETLDEEYKWLEPQEVVEVVNALDSLTEKEMKDRSSEDANK